MTFESEYVRRLINMKKESPIPYRLSCGKPGTCIEKVTGWVFRKIYAPIDGYRYPVSMLTATSVSVLLLWVVSLAIRWPLEASDRHSDHFQITLEFLKTYWQLEFVAALLLMSAFADDVGAVASVAYDVTNWNWTSSVSNVAYGVSMAKYVYYAIYGKLDCLIRLCLRGATDTSFSCHVLFFGRCSVAQYGEHATDNEKLPKEYSRSVQRRCKKFAFYEKEDTVGRCGKSWRLALWGSRPRTDLFRYLDQNTWVTNSRIPYGVSWSSSEVQADERLFPYRVFRPSRIPVYLSGRLSRRSHFADTHATVPVFQGCCRLLGVSTFFSHGQLGT